AFGESDESTQALAALLKGAARWGDLAGLLERTAARAASNDARTDLLCELGDVQRERLGQVRAAIESYHAALRVDAQSARARAGPRRRTSGAPWPTRSARRSTRPSRAGLLPGACSCGSRWARCSSLASTIRARRSAPICAWWPSRPATKGRRSRRSARRGA